MPGVGSGGIEWANPPLRHPGPVTSYMLGEFFIPAWIRDLCAESEDICYQKIASMMVPVRPFDWNDYPEPGFGTERFLP